MIYPGVLPLTENRRTPEAHFAFPREAVPNYQSRDSLMASPSLANDGNKSNVQRTKPSLSQLPFEIKQCIVYWVDLIQKDPYRSDSDSHVEEIDHGTPGSTKSRDHLRQLFARPSADLMRILNINPFSHTTSTTKNHTKRSTRPKCESILALCLVDRMFYEVCRPLIWQVSRSLSIFTSYSTDFHSSQRP
ncbi:hypothetical protein Pst134EA_022589 [Puccinia striiformis f. sp. tritici]|uniref:hypothetical protein n=1 Tax=Puccinia striiformis f. sp. tritici TaxID=168172 RepID=UPI002007C46C|nr:hypothetical protein Pst134EA_022589 [Puccinia striiformis f. sp. tritici]KAH9455113.1 hypothetical protein Pst134EA_022589 [Puccinia striiformis f. sp. tritici]